MWNVGDCSVWGFAIGQGEDEQLCLPTGQTIKQDPHGKGQSKHRPKIYSR